MTTRQSNAKLQEAMRRKRKSIEHAASLKRLHKMATTVQRGCNCEFCVEQRALKRRAAP